MIIQVGQSIGVAADDRDPHRRLDPRRAAAAHAGPQRLAALQRAPSARAAFRRARSLDGVLVIFGGALLITPGFLTDILGILLLLPPTRAVFRRLLVRRFTQQRVVVSGRRRAASGAPADRARQDYDVDGTAVERDDLRLQP